MSEARAMAKHIRLSPRKVRQVVDLIRGKTVGEAMAILKFSPQRAATAIGKVVKSAAANAEHNLEMDKDALFIAEAYVDQGPTLKRYNPRAMGRADLIKRRTSHITVVVKEKEELLAEKEDKTAKKKKKPAAAKKTAASKKKETEKKEKPVTEKKKVVRQKKETVPEPETVEPEQHDEEAADDQQKAVRKKKEG